MQRVPGERFRGERSEVDVRGAGGGEGRLGSLGGEEGRVCSTALMKAVEGTRGDEAGRRLREQKVRAREWRH